MSEQQQGEDLAATDRAAAPNTTFLSKYLQGLDSGNKRAIARNAARGAQQAVGASGAAALRPTLHKAAGRGVDSVRRAVLMSAEQSKHTLCVALLREVAQVFGYSLSVTVDGQEQEAVAEQLQPLPLGAMHVKLSTHAPVHIHTPIIAHVAQVSGYSLLHDAHCPLPPPPKPLNPQVAQVFGYSLSVTVDGQEQEAVADAADAEQLQPLPLCAIHVKLSSGAAAAAQQQRQQHLEAAAAVGRLHLASHHHRLQLAAFRAIGLPGSRANSVAAAARLRALRRAGSGNVQQQQQPQQDGDRPQEQQALRQARQQQDKKLKQQQLQLQAQRQQQQQQAAADDDGDSSEYEEVLQDDEDAGVHDKQQQQQVPAPAAGSAAAAASADVPEPEAKRRRGEQQQQQQQQRGSRRAVGWEANRGLSADDDGWEEVPQEEQDAEMEPEQQQQQRRQQQQQRRRDYGWEEVPQEEQDAEMEPEQQQQQQQHRRGSVGSASRGSSPDIALDNDQVVNDVDLTAETEIGVAAAASSQGQGSTVPGSARPASVEQRRNSVSPTAVGLAGQPIPNEYIVIFKKGADVRAATASVRARAVSLVQTASTSSSSSSERVSPAAAELAVTVVTGFKSWKACNPSECGLGPVPPPGVLPVVALNATERAIWAMQRVGEFNSTDRTVVDISAAMQQEKNKGLIAVVIDTGIDSGHPELNVIGFKDMRDEPGSLWYNKDGNGHGTHVAGIIGARRNDRAIVGVAPGMPLYAIKVMSAEGKGKKSTVLEAFREVVAMLEAGRKIAVLNLSFVMSTGDAPLDPEDFKVTCDLLKQIAGYGVSTSAAAGNVYGKNLQWFLPGACPDVMAVTSLNRYDYPSDFSNAALPTAAPAVLNSVMAAPGEDIISTYPTYLPMGPFAKLDGTSQATPFVSGGFILCLLTEKCKRSDVPGEVAAAAVNFPVLQGLAKEFPCGKLPGGCGPDWGMPDAYYGYMVNISSFRAS
ncbi:hypothetical protein OEZ86_014056 [Tetradesmus obliquus]|nr:hypothetical protein OEZ86_014056 [Tetradesmus obliquus]